MGITFNPFSGQLVSAATIRTILHDGTSVAVSTVTPSDVRAPSVSNGSLRIPRPIVGDWFNDLPNLAAVAAWDARKGLTVSDAVDAAQDLTGHGSNCTQTTTARPTYTATGFSDGGPEVVFNGSTQWMACDGVIPQLQKNTPRTFVFFGRFDAVTSDKPLFAASGASAPNITVYGNLTGVGRILADGSPKYGPAFGSPAILYAGAEHLVVVSHVSGAGNSSVWVDGQRYIIAEDCVTAGSALVHASLGCYLLYGTYNPTAFFDGSMRFAGLFSGVATDADYVAMCRGLLGQKYVRVVCDGNSLTAGGNGGIGWYPRQLQAKLDIALGGSLERDASHLLGGTRAFTTNTGQGGQTIAGMVTRYPTYVKPLLCSGAVNILVAWEITNTYAASVGAKTARQCLDEFWAYCDTARADGFTVVGITATKRIVGGFVGIAEATADAFIDAVNVLFMEEWQLHLDAVVPAHTNLALMSCKTNTYMSADGTHYTDAGCSIVASMVAKEVLRLVAQLG